MRHCPAKSVSTNFKVTCGGEAVCPPPATRGEVEVDSRQSVGERPYHLSPIVEAEKCKVGPAPGNTLGEGLVQHSSNSTVGESKYYLAPTVEAGQPLKTS